MQKIRPAAPLPGGRSPRDLSAIFFFFFFGKGPAARLPGGQIRLIGRSRFSPFGFDGLDGSGSYADGLDRLDLEGWEETPHSSARQQLHTVLVFGTGA